MITKEQTKEFINRAYATACAHGFHDEELSVEHCMMLVLSEVGEAVEADRRVRRANLRMFDTERKTYQPDSMMLSHWMYSFGQFIKDTVEDELADVCIRLYDICGFFDIEPETEIEDGELCSVYEDECRGKSFCERCFILSALLCHCEGKSIEYDGTDECLPNVIGSALLFVNYLSEDMGIDLERHIRLKMKYNELRPSKHGKLY